MGQQLREAVRALAWCSRSIPMVQALRTCTVFFTATELVRVPDCLPIHRAAPYMGRQAAVALRATARCSPSAPTAQVLRTCTVSRRSLAHFPVLTVTELS